ncbi:MAG: pyridoxine 5'-phosphate synthase [Magnetococcales bacterium]|nr:pyridoxine 5'-phosphate synthase [Magnetococcales bacterium]MBF0151308.1 pyridoxine 5'-phosphate synthase [Magnetococcales bacterium]MBF0173380.1 pyridoxine 5'-phosphate synthase [Magnetococcales bacterium]
MIKLGVNVDHIATLREARGERYPDPVAWALEAERSGADSITVHLREDRRHIQERDVLALLEMTQTRVNLEMAATPAMIAWALAHPPADCCLVPEKREELTTEGGLDVVSHAERLREVVQTLIQAGIEVSLFIDPLERQIRAAKGCGARVVELHTGRFAEARDRHEREGHLEALRQGAGLAHELGLRVHAGHGLHYHNVMAVAAIAPIVELNIGHAIVSRAVFTGLGEAVGTMKALIRTHSWK